MSPVVLRGINWGHRRATGSWPALIERFRELHPQIDVEWSVRSLADFEHEGIAEVAQRYDFAVFDHPFCGDIAASAAFRPIDELIGASNLLADERFVGPSLASYRYDGHLWGAPIDGATQNAIYRADLLDAEALPATWSEVRALGTRLQARGLFLGLPCVTPHAILGVAALMASTGRAWSTDPAQPFSIDRSALVEAMEAMASVLSYCPPECLGWNSIDLHEQMVARDDIAYAPCVYGYATYGEADLRRRLSFAPFPGPDAAGTAIGGTAIAVSKSCPQSEARALVEFFLGDEAQLDIVPRLHGQPALAVPWDDPAIDARFNGYFSATRSTMETAWIRPRLPGYPRFQRLAGIVVQRALAGEIGIGAAADEIVVLAEDVNA